VIEVWEKQCEDLLASDKKNVSCWEDAFFRVFYTGTRFGSSQEQDKWSAEWQYASVNTGSVATALTSWKALQTSTITDESASKEKAAYQTYITDVWSNEGTYLDTCFGIASGLLDAWYNGLDGLEQSVESATKSADDALRNAAKNADTTSDMITYLKKAAQADVDYAKALEANLGVYQKAWRQSICDGLSPNDPARSLWLTEIAFVGKVGDARNVYMTGLGNASMLYTNTTLDAYAVFNNACWTASDTYYNGMYGASSAYSSSMRSANKMYARAGFEADKSHTLAIFSAAKTKAIADAEPT